MPRTAKVPGVACRERRSIAAGAVDEIVFTPIERPLRPVDQPFQLWVVARGALTRKLDLSALAAAVTNRVRMKIESQEVSRWLKI